MKPKSLMIYSLAIAAGAYAIEKGFKLASWIGGASNPQPAPPKSAPNTAAPSSPARPAIVTVEVDATETLQWVKDPAKRMEVLNQLIERSKSEGATIILKYRGGGELARIENGVVTPAKDFDPFRTTSTP